MIVFHTSDPFGQIKDILFIFLDCQYHAEMPPKECKTHCSFKVQMYLRWDFDTWDITILGSHVPAMLAWVPPPNAKKRFFFAFDVGFDYMMFRF